MTPSTARWAALGFLALAACRGAPTIYQLAPGAVRIAHDRPDLTVDVLALQLICAHPDGSWAESDCYEIEIDGLVRGPEVVFHASKSQPNIVETPRVVIRYWLDSERILCLGTKVLFVGHPNESDFVLYTDPNDRYSVLSYCTAEVLPGRLATQPRFAHRRARSWHEFATRFSDAITLDLAAERGWPQ